MFCACGHQGIEPMRKFWVFLARELSSYFYSPIAYIVLVFFLLVSGVDFYFQISFMNQRAAGYSVQEAFFNSVFFWFAFVLIFPLITMRLFSEEFKLGTIEPLTTAPVRDWQIVLAKYFGALVFYIILWLPTAIYFWIFQAITHQPAANSPGAYWGAYLMLLLLGMFYLSVGCLASVLTKNQIIAAVISFCAITLLFFLGLIQFILLDVSAGARQLLGYFSAIEQMGTLSRGIIDTRPIVLYLSMTIVMLILTYQAFQSRKWRI
jgi:ABC-2 type transport system permease protein